MTAAQRHRDYTRWPVVEGFCARQSVEAGETVAVHCASRSASFTAEVARIGATRVVVWSRSSLTAADHGVPDRAWEVGCDWPVAFIIETEPDWPSGFYEITLAAEDVAGPQSVAHAFFVLRRPPSRAANPALLVLSTNTYNAYNQWGGACLYSGAHAVSFARPIERGYLRRPAAPDQADFDGRIANVADPSDPEHRRLVEYQWANDYPLWCASSGWHNWERRFVRWAEARGFSFDYAINSDLDASADALAGHEMLISVGHDEYWSWGMRDSVDAWVGDGGNWAILSGNTCFWQVRYEDDGRTMICHKGDAMRHDPVAGTRDQHLLTSMWSDPAVGRPETSTTGLTFTRGGYYRMGQAVADGTGAYTVHQPDHWAFDGTELSSGEPLGLGSFIVGYEVDGCALDGDRHQPSPTHEDGAPHDLQVLATAPARLISITDDVCEAPEALWATVDPPGDLEDAARILFGDASAKNVARIAAGHAVMAEFSRGAGTVFNAGSADWAYGLDSDARVQRVTANVLNRLAGYG